MKVKLFDSRIYDAIQTLILGCYSDKKLNLCISATGAHGIIIAQKDEKFKKILNSFYLNLPDGMPGVWIGRLKGAKNMERCYGPDFFKEVIIATRDKEIKHFFCGGIEGVAESLKKVCEEKFGNKNIVGIYSPPFRELTDDEMKNLADNINSLRTNIVWIGLSTPKQEIFAYRLSKFTNVNFICTVGAAFDFHTGRIRQAPKLIQRIGMEWFFRMLMEPKRLWRRYFEIVPLFIWYNLIELIKGKFIANNKLKEVN
ncbi:WecB/TagA/CpsF family glycosyltransferase [Rosettibacter primus]|uniref:WecB/TagA/CpsF family glycosyltransferase n=1 Tax=Rosettibacter primus TaxID=3111523 RepID=UPI00336BB4AF